MSKPVELLFLSQEDVVAAGGMDISTTIEALVKVYTLLGNDQAQDPVCPQIQYDNDQSKRFQAVHPAWLAGDVNVTGNFWVWCERLEDYPHALGADFMWNGGHYAITDGIDYDLSFNAEGGNELMFFAKGEGTVGVNDAPAMPSAYKLEAAYPNPFNPVTTIAFTAPAGEMASLKVYNLNGQLVSTLFEGETMGHTQVQFDASALASGVYFARLSTQSGFTSAQKLVLVK